MSSLLSPLDNILLDCTLFPPSPSDISDQTSPSPPPPPDPIHVVCNVPLLAPRPLPYHSPTFLQFELPDSDEDLSHPPYINRPQKRKRDEDDVPAISPPQPKRRTGVHRSRSRLPHRPWDHPSPHPPHRSGNYRIRT